MTHNPSPYPAWAHHTPMTDTRDLSYMHRGVPLEEAPTAPDQFFPLTPARRGDAIPTSQYTNTAAEPVARALDNWPNGNAGLDPSPPSAERIADRSKVTVARAAQNRSQTGERRERQERRPVPLMSMRRPVVRQPGGTDGEPLLRRLPESGSPTTHARLEESPVIKQMLRRWQIASVRRSYEKSQRHLAATGAVPVNEPACIRAEADRGAELESDAWGVQPDPDVEMQYRRDMQEINEAEGRCGVDGREVAE